MRENPESERDIYLSGNLDVTLPPPSSCSLLLPLLLPGHDIERLKLRTSSAKPQIAEDRPARTEEANEIMF